MINIIENDNGYFLYYAGLSEEEVTLGKSMLCSRPSDLSRLRYEIENGEFAELSNEKWRIKLLETMISDSINARKVRENVLKNRSTLCRCYQCCKDGL